MDGHRSQLLRVGWRPSYLSTMTLLCTGSGWDEQPLHTPLPSMPWNVHICDRMMGGGMSMTPNLNQEGILAIDIAIAMEPSGGDW